MSTLPSNAFNHADFSPFLGALESDRGLPSGLLTALIGQESGGNVNAVSPTGAQGVAQFMPATAQAYNVNVKDPFDSARGAADMMKDLIAHYGSVPAALAAYNGGTAAGKAVQAGQLAPSPETQAYVPAVLNRMAVANATTPQIPPQQAQAAQPAPQTPQAPATPQNQPDFSGITPDVVAATRAGVQNMVQQGIAPDLIVNRLAQGPNAPLVQQMLKNGYSNTDILNEIGGAATQATQAANQQVGNQSFGQNVIQGAGNSLGDTWNGIKQLGDRVVGNTDGLHTLQQQMAARLADPTRQALSNTVGSDVGHIGATVAPLLIPGVGELGIGADATGTAGRMALMGAAQGAVTPTTGDGQFLPNVLTGAAGGAVIGGGAHALSSALGAIGSKVSAMGTAGDAAQARLAAELGGRVGVPDATAVNSDLVSKAQQVNGDLFEGAVKGQDITLPTDFSKTINNISGQLDSTPKILTKVGNYADGTQVPAQDLLTARSQLAAKMSSPALDGSDKGLISDAIEHIDNTLQQGLPGPLADQLQTARTQWRNLQPIEQMVARSNDSGVITPNVFNSSIKAGRNKNSFVSGQAPLQDLQGSDLINDLQTQPGLLSKFGPFLEMTAASHHPIIGGGVLLAKQLAEAGAPTAGRAIAGLGDSINPVQAAMLAQALGTNAPGAGLNR